MNSNKSKKENIIPLNENEVKNIEVENEEKEELENDNEKDVDVSDYEGDEEENDEDEEYTDREGEKEEENESVYGEYVSNKKMYVIDDDEDLDEEKSLTENIVIRFFIKSIQTFFRN